ncbi:MAG: hypothetical protein WC314_03665 [Vulcanimicrobiota bacterium]
MWSLGRELGLGVGAFAAVDVGFPTGVEGGLGAVEDVFEADAVG